MSLDPNVVIAALISIPKNVEIDDFLNSVGVGSDNEIQLGSDLYYVYRSVSEECIIEKENSFVIQSYITHGWGSTCSLLELKTKTETFEETIKLFCNQYNLTYAIHIGANFW